MSKTKFFISILLLTHNILFAQDTLYLHNDWSFSKARVENWYPASVPGTVHQDLIANKLIDDPFYFDNELKQYWIEHTDWVYKNKFQILANQLTAQKIVLNFEGLDTYTEINLNGKCIQKTNNMFLGYEIDVKQDLKVGQNELEIYFHSPTKINSDKAEKHPYTVPAVNEYAKPKQRFSVYSRKAPYHFGWDWGPRMVTSGIWRPCYLTFSNNVQIKSVYYDLQKLDSKKAIYNTELEIEVFKPGTFVADLYLNDKKIASQTRKLEAGISTVPLEFSITRPQLWWSAGLGNPYLYNTKIVIKKDKQIIAQKSQKLGVRTIEVIQEKDNNLGRTFKVRLNGLDVFMKGSNYIPPDNLIPRINKSHYENIIKSTVEANMNMLRVWGGAVYEDNNFYDLCDQYGVLVWQDFMFACAMTPSDSAHLKNIEQEFEYNVKRLRTHASIALWCGNNENMEKWFTKSWKNQYGVSTSDSSQLMNTYVRIFYKMIPDILKKYDAKRFYWPSSPGSSYEISQANSISGDVHNWWIWFGYAKFQDIARDKRRFISEYGLQSYPSWETLMSFARPQDTAFDTYVYDLRQRSGLLWNATESSANLSRGNEMIKKYVEMYFREPKDFKSFIYLSQIMQGEGLKQITEGHRAAKPYCWGSLYWQIDDCWPTISWSSIDYFYRWKASHYMIKQANQPIIITPVESKGSPLLNIYGVNDKNKSSDGNLKMTIKDFDGKMFEKIELAVSMTANDSKALYSFDLNDLKQKYDSTSTYIELEYTENNGQFVVNSYFFTEPKNLKLSVVNPEIQFLAEGNQKVIILKTTKLARWVHLSLSEDMGYFSNNAFDLFPSKSIKINYNGKLSIEELKSKLKLSHLANSYK